MLSRYIINDIITNKLIKNKLKRLFSALKLRDYL
jgi:hypothetical protein